MKVVILILLLIFFSSQSGYNQNSWMRQHPDYKGEKTNSVHTLPKYSILKYNYFLQLNSELKIINICNLPDTRSGIQRDIFQSSLIKKKEYDLPEREITTFVNEKLNPGTYEVKFDSGNLPSGIYFYRMEAEKFTSTKKLILLK